MSLSLNERNLDTFELFIVENIEERFKQLSLEAPKFFIVLQISSMGTHRIRWNMKKFMPVQYSRTVLKRRSLENFLRLTNIWLMEAKLTLIDLRTLSRYQVNKLITSSPSNYVVDNKLFSLHITLEKKLC